MRQRYMCSASSLVLVVTAICYCGSAAAGIDGGASPPRGDGSRGVAPASNIAGTPIWTYESNAAGARFGASAATAGDVNGDGYSDVIVGAPEEYDAQSGSVGRAYLFLGGPGGPSATPHWTSRGNQTASSFGYSVAPAGDVNGDGFDDVLVGAPFGTLTPCASGGSVYLFLGTPAGLQASWAWSAELCGATNPQFGYSIGTAGDVNGDGFADIIIGAPFRSSPAANQGSASVYLGSPSGPGAIPDWTVLGPHEDALFGNSVATAGDVNADGYADVIVGAYFANPGGGAYVYLGSASGLSLTPQAELHPASGLADFGYQAGPAGDVTGDGYADVFVSAPLEGVHGATYVYPGSAIGVGMTPVWSFATWGEYMGESAGSAGDVNGDGRPDLIIGMPQDRFAGSGTNGWAGLWFGDANNGLEYRDWGQVGVQANEHLGANVGTAGDVNGDGFSDLIVGSRGWSNGQAGEGRAQIWLGAGDNPIGTVARAYTGFQENDAMGWSVCASGDFNGDGYSDLLTGSPLYDVGADEPDRGLLAAALGGGFGVGSGFDWLIAGAVPGEQLGVAVAASDVNGDGYDDVIAGCPGYQAQGRVVVFSGGPTGPGYTIEAGIGGAAGSLFGRSVAAAGDVNGDGYGDVIVGAPNFTATYAEEGQASVYLGSASGLATTPAWSTAGGQAYAHLGTSVAGAGDINRDGYSDIIVGAPDYDRETPLPVEPDAGRALVFLGGPSGPAVSPAWTRFGAQGSRLGNSVASAGDVDGDGCSDIIIAAVQAAGGGTEGGRVTVYRGSTSSPWLQGWWAVDGGQSYDGFGASVASAGDVNGDGLSDVAVGAVFYDTDGFVDNGAVFVFGGPLTGLLSTEPLCMARGSANWMNVGHAVAGAGDLNGDGFADFISGAPGAGINYWRDGQVFVYYGGGVYNPGLGGSHAARQTRTGGAAPLALLGSTNESLEFALRALGVSPAGRTRVRLQWQVTALGAPFSLGTPVSSPWSDTGGILGADIGGLNMMTPFHWRLRVQAASPYFPRSPWLSPPGNGPMEADFRTGQNQAAAPDRRWAPPGLTASISPNPFRTRTWVRYSLPRATRLEVRVFDVRGRLLTTLDAGEAPAGPGQLAWDGRAASGDPLPSGIYFARIYAAGEVITRKLQLVR